jgi:uncharacterized membrane protein YfcA
MSTTTLLFAGLVLAFGALVQGIVGFGIAIIGVPIAALIQPDLVPGPLVLIAPIHTMLSLVREFHDVDWRGVGWAMIGRLPGTVVGVLIVDSLPQRQFFAVVGAGVLIFTMLSMISWQPRPTPQALTTAGLVGGAFGTAMAIGGPPVALLYQRDTGARIRATLAAYLLLGSVVSAASLAMVGHLGGHEFALAGLLAPFVMVGFALSGPARRLVDGGRIRYAVLALAGASALMLIGRSVLL